MRARRLLLMMTAVVLLSAVCFVVVYAVDQPASSTATTPADIREASAGYRNLRRMTPDSVTTSIPQAMMCAPASADHDEKARLEFGPHASALVDFYMNDGARDAFKKYHTAATQPAEHRGATRPAVAYPVGAVIVKEKHGMQRDTDSLINGIGGMIKRPPGFDPAHGDWVYFYQERGKPVEFGKIDTCVKCHDNAARTDHVFGNWAKEL